MHLANKNEPNPNSNNLFGRLRKDGGNCVVPILVLIVNYMSFIYSL